MRWMSSTVFDLLKANPNTVPGEMRLALAREHVAFMLTEYGGWKDQEKALEAGERIARKAARACER